MESLVVDPDFWRGRRVLVTGHTGFKGAWLSLWLKELGASLTGFSLEPPTTPSLFSGLKLEQLFERHLHGDIRDLDRLSSAIEEARPEIVIHLAAQSLVCDSYLSPVETYSTNVMGTVHLLDAVRRSPTVKAVLNITSDKCYENREWCWGYRENDPMGGYDPYSSSKGCAELVSAAYRRSFLEANGVAMATARAGNVIGGGDWARDRIVPDAMRAFGSGNVLEIRNPSAIRPWQHVLEPLSGYLLLCQRLIDHPDGFAEGWNFGPSDDDNCSVGELVEILASAWGEGAQWHVEGQPSLHEANLLRLDCSKARSRLKWRPRWGLDQALEETVMWYKTWYERGELLDFTLHQVRRYQQEVYSQ